MVTYAAAYRSTYAAAVVGSVATAYGAAYSNPLVCTYPSAYD